MKMEADAKRIELTKRVAFLVENDTKKMVRIGRVRVEAESGARIVPNQDAPYDALTQAHRNGIKVVGIELEDGTCLFFAEAEQVEADALAPVPTPAPKPVPRLEITKVEEVKETEVKIELQIGGDEPPFDKGEPEAEEAEDVEAEESEPSKLTREQLEALEYTEIQALCREKGLSSRGKREELIAALLAI